MTRGVQPPTRADVVQAHRPLRLLVLHQHYWPEVAATAQILADLCEDLAVRGHHVTVVCGQPSYRSHSAQRLPREERHAGVEIIRVWSYAPLKRSIPKRIAHYGSYFGSSLLASLTRKPFDVCLVMSTPPLLLGVTGALLRLLRGVPFVYSVQDLYPDVAVHLGVLREDSLATRSIDVAASSFYRAASAVVTLSPGMAQHLADKGVARERLHVIPNWADTDAIAPMPRDNDFARAHGLADGFVAQYSGNIGMSQGLDAVVQAADLLQGTPIRFAFIGDGNARTRLESLCRARRLTNVVFLPPQPRERLAELLASCEVGLVPMKRHISNDLVPSKLYGIMAASRPVLAAAEPESEAARVVHTHACGLTCEPENADALASCLHNALRTVPAELKAMGARGRKACGDHYSRLALTGRYAEVLTRVATSVAATRAQSNATVEWLNGPVVGSSTSRTST